MKVLTARILALLCAASCALVATADLLPVFERLRTGVQNRDGHVDQWRRYDAHGQLTEIDRDTNFDGSPDVQEYFRGGALVRRESDRNFNGQTDLVEEFDVDTHVRTRSVVDVDYDGVADILVLYADGQPVFSKHLVLTEAHRTSRTLGSSHRTDGHRLAQLVDPSDSDTALRSAPLAAHDEESVGLSTSGGLPGATYALLAHDGASTAIVAGHANVRVAALRSSHAPRAPPIS